MPEPLTPQTAAGPGAPASPTRRAQRRRSTWRRPRSGWRFVRDVVVILVIAIVASTLIRTFLVRSFYIPSGSMENTLVSDDRVLVNELVPALIPIERGDVLVFSDPGGWLPTPTPTIEPPLVAAVNGLLDLTGLSPSDSNDHLIKRVIGLPGDRVVCCNFLGQTTVNEVVLDEPYLRDALGTTLAVSFSVTVPAGHLWVEGDNRGNSKDSRLNLDTPEGGFVPIETVVGRALITTYPITRWTYLDNFPGVFEGVPGPAG